MKKSRIGTYVAVVVGIAILLVIFSLNPNETKIEGYHITLADPGLYKNGIFSDNFNIKKGNYEFRFVPNGDSPEILTIRLEGNSFSFSEDFHLEGTPHETGISVYYTWDYLGVKEITIQENQKLTILINPNENILGPVSIDLIPLK